MNQTQLIQAVQLTHSTSHPQHSSMAGTWQSFQRPTPGIATVTLHVASSACASWCYSGLENGICWIIHHEVQLPASSKRRRITTTALEVDRHCGDDFCPLIHVPRNAKQFSWAMWNTDHQLSLAKYPSKLYLNSEVELSSSMLWSIHIYQCL